MRFFSVAFIILFLNLGCDAVYQSTKSATKPVGKATSVISGVSDGALEGYDQEEKDNPYNR
ncbi:MAG: hypothetical protein PHV17_10230 [Candidatus Omnitrophica bacterium]|nr:hypothetical protein [Candidatus Omnitrophota bacterium]